jgi:phage N-6-adenine-methyltransferase
MAYDSWETPKYLFDQLNAEFHFDIDLCATRENKKCDWYCNDYLLNQVNDNGQLFNPQSYCCGFMNPPYSDPLPFVQKAWEDSLYCKIVMLLPVRTSTKWWSVFWNYQKIHEVNTLGRDYVNNIEAVEHKFIHRGPKPGVEVRFFPKRIAFVRDGKEVKGTSFDSCIVILDRRGIE